MPSGISGRPWDIPTRPEGRTAPGRPSLGKDDRWPSIPTRPDSNPIYAGAIILKINLNFLLILLRIYLLKILIFRKIKKNPYSLRSKKIYKKKKILLLKTAISINSEKLFIDFPIYEICPTTSGSVTAIIFLNQFPAIIILINK